MPMRLQSSSGATDEQWSLSESVAHQGVKLNRVTRVGQLDVETS